MVHRSWCSSSRAVTAIVGAAIWLAVATTANAQVGTLVAPGPLSKAHSQLEGLANCQKCHQPGRALASAKCLACHKPIAERIAGRRGVHRDVPGSCEKCHVEHRGTAVDIRRLDIKAFNHAVETGFALDGRHAPLSQDCARCHKTRSFLNAGTACVSCHQDPHKGALGTTCAECHTTATPFADARKQFDHAKARFALTGAHRTVDCAKCHVNKVYRGLKFGSCADCHREPHRQAFGPDCTTCHTTETWKTRTFDHARTAFPLKGAHATAACTACHVKPADTGPPPGEGVPRLPHRCSRRTVQAGLRLLPYPGDVQEGAVRPRHGDSVPAHRAPHRARLLPAATRARPPPARRGRRAQGSTIAVKFSGLSAACASCHDDVHRGAAGQACDSCHTTTDFRGLKPYTHAAPLAAFFSGRHAAAACRECHGREAGAPPPPATAKVTSWTFKGLGTACARCHSDPHNQELGNACERCHAVDEIGFAAGKFSHGTTAFQLTGRHAALRCSQCHAPRAVRPASRRPARACRLRATTRDASCRSRPRERPARRATRTSISDSWARSARAATRPRRSLSRHTRTSS